MPYMVTFTINILPNVSIYTSTMDPSWVCVRAAKIGISIDFFASLLGFRQKWDDFYVPTISVAEALGNPLPAELSLEPQ